MDMASDPFFDQVYRDAPDYYGHEVRPDFAEFLSSLPADARCLDLGCGQGRHTLFAARRGIFVHAVDYSDVAADQLRALAGNEGLPVEVESGDVRDLHPALGSYDGIFMVSFLSHLGATDVQPIVDRTLTWLKPGGGVYVEAFTTADPAFLHEPDKSETSPALKHFFAPGAVRRLFQRYAISDYREFVEDDLTHGPAHRHGVALLVGARPA
jgi:cyclopropane fatty-acyl-phospholipid synthase-like methyltransferase